MSDAQHKGPGPPNPSRVREMLERRGKGVVKQRSGHSVLGASLGPASVCNSLICVGVIGLRQVCVCVCVCVRHLWGGAGVCVSAGGEYRGMACVSLCVACRWVRWGVNSGSWIACVSLCWGTLWELEVSGVFQLGIFAFGWCMRTWVPWEADRRMDCVCEHTSGLAGGVRCVSV